MDSNRGLSALAAGARAAASLAWRAAPGNLVMGAACALLSGTLPVVVAWFTKAIIDRLASPSPGQDVLTVALGLVSGMLLVAVVPRVSQYARVESDRAVAALAQERLFTAVDRFGGLARFEDPGFLDRLRLAQQSGGHAPGQIVYSIFDFVGGVMTVSGLLGSLLVLSPPMTVVVAVAAVPVLVAELRLSRRHVAMLWGISAVERREYFYASLLSSVQAAKEIRLFGSGAFLRRRMLKERRTADAERRRIDQRELRVHSGLALLSAGTAGAGLLWAVMLASRGQLSLGDVSLFIAVVAGVQGAVSRVTSVTAMAHQQLLMFDHYLAVLGAEPDLAVPRSPVALPGLRRGIELRDVWFRYSDDHPWVLRGVNLFIPHGRATALVGRNGSGKSTLVKLLCRFYDPVKGQILWDGVDLREVPVEKLRARIGAVFQDFVCYDMSATENIALGDVTAIEDPARIERAAAAAGIHEQLARLPRGYRTLLTRTFPGDADEHDPETGVVLSGGQWQRLSLARAMLRDEPDLLILDEPSSGLDAEAEHEIHTRLRERRAGRTSLLISHRLGAIRDADLIVVLSEGEIAEYGTHDELMDHAGTYETLFQLQAAGYTSSQSRAEEPTP
ncbi:ABC transporter ATP-binding protein [Nonomuraea sp. JJY05]|uniref:ABC transporter ATP-binding protein n=1 Tax=Nonomuraea sp. JJY05 TaxID=3350255 RepID=UPI00373F6893